MAHKLAKNFLKVKWLKFLREFVLTFLFFALFLLNTSMSGVSTYSWTTNSDWNTGGTFANTMADSGGDLSLTPGNVTGTYLSNTASLAYPATSITALWNDTVNWRYRVPVNISNPGSALIGYQVNVTITDAQMIGGMNVNATDLRFTDSAGSPLNHWVESYTPTKLTAWVKVLSIPAGNSAIYMYYGNPNAASAGNRSAVFGYKTQDFTDSVNNKAYYGKDLPGSIPVGVNRTTWNVGGVEFSAGNYTLISSSNDARSYLSADVLRSQQLVHDFVFKVDDSTIKSTAINITWEGYGSKNDEATADNDLRMYLLNANANLFELKGSKLDNSCPGISDCAMTFALNNNISSYLDGTGRFRFLIQKYETRCGDADGDGYESNVCGGTDCNDANANVYQNQNVATDADQDGYSTSSASSQCVGASTTVSGRTYYKNSAGNYYFIASGSILGTSDCNDANSNAYPGNTFCGGADGIDNNCDGTADNCCSSYCVTLGVQCGNGYGYGCTGATGACGGVGEISYQCYSSCGVPNGALCWSGTVCQTSYQTACCGATACNGWSSPFLYFYNGSSYEFVSDFIPGATSPAKQYASFTDISDVIREGNNNKYRLKITEELNETTYLDKIMLVAYDYTDESDFNRWFNDNFEKVNERNYRKLTDYGTYGTESIIPLIEITGSEGSLLERADNKHLVMDLGAGHFLEFDSDKRHKRLFFVADGYYLGQSNKNLPHNSLYTDYAKLDVEYRKYASPEPSVIVASAQETVGPYSDLNTQDPKLTIEVSANGGTTWHTATNNTPFSMVGDSGPLTNLLFRATLFAKSSWSPRLSDITLFVESSGTPTPTPAPTPTQTQTPAPGGPPSVTLSGSPPPNLTCSATSYNGTTLKNITLYTNFTGSWIPEQSVNLAGTSNYSTIAFQKQAPIAGGNYSWNCLALDSGGLSAFAAANATATVTKVRAGPAGMAMEMTSQPSVVSGNIVSFTARIISNATESIVSVIPAISIADQSKVTNLTITPSIISLLSANGSANFTISFSYLTSGKVSISFSASGVGQQSSLATSSNTVESELYFGAQFSLSLSSNKLEIVPNGGSSISILAKNTATFTREKVRLKLSDTSCCSFSLVPNGVDIPAGSAATFTLTLSPVSTAQPGTTYTTNIVAYTDTEPALASADLTISILKDLVPETGAAREKALSAIKNANDTIVFVDVRIADAEKQKLDTYRAATTLAEARSLYNQAIELLEQGDYDGAYLKGTDASTKAQSALILIPSAPPAVVGVAVTKETADASIKTAEETILFVDKQVADAEKQKLDAYEAATTLTEARGLIKQAKAALGSGDYASAAELASQGTALATSALQSIPKPGQLPVSKLAIAGIAILLLAVEVYLRFFRKPPTGPPHYTQAQQSPRYYRPPPVR